MHVNILLSYCRCKLSVTRRGDISEISLFPSRKGDEYEYSCRREHQSLWREEVNKVSEVRTTSAVFYLHRVLTESFSVL